MEIGILGTGGVARTLARRWSVAGHHVTLGSRDPSSKGDLGSLVAPVMDVVAGHDVVVNATPGSASLELAEGIGAAALAGKILIDGANANTPSLELVYPNSSLAEKLQAALPETHVVKTMNTAAMAVMTDPATLPAISFLRSASSCPVTTGGRRRRSPACSQI
jgi:predicted dinucleotide-binding enzyme